MGTVAISLNLYPAAFDELMPKTLATATVDWLLHHAHIYQTTGESVPVPSTGRPEGECLELYTRPMMVNTRADPTAITGQIP